MSTTFWRDPNGNTWAHLADIRAAVSANGRPNSRQWGGALASRDALIALAFDRGYIVRDLDPALRIDTVNPADQVVVLGHKSRKTVGTGLVELVIVPSSHPMCQGGARRPRSLIELARVASPLTMNQLGLLLNNWHN